jgi:hypothetical protein
MDNDKPLDTQGLTQTIDDIDRATEELVVASETVIATYKALKDTNQSKLAVDQSFAICRLISFCCIMVTVSVPLLVLAAFMYSSISIHPDCNSPNTNRPMVYSRWYQNPHSGISMLYAPKFIIVAHEYSSDYVVGEFLNELLSNDKQIYKAWIRRTTDPYAKAHLIQYVSKSVGVFGDQCWIKAT